MSTVEQAEQALAEAQRQVERWSAELATKEAELAQVRQHAGADALADPDAAPRITQAIVELTAAVDVTRSAAETAEERVKTGRRNVLRAKAQHLRERAARLRQAADERWKTTARLLDQLREHEQADFIHFTTDDIPLHLVPVGYRPNLSPSGGLYGKLTPRAPVTLQLRWQADQLDQAAGELDKRAAGTESEVAARFGRPLPEPTPAEREYVGA